MADRTDRSAAAERMAGVSIIVGTAAVIAGAGLLGLVVMTGGVPGLPPMGLVVGLLPGLVMALLGLGLVMRGVHLNATLDTLANIRLLQEETHRARTQASVYSHAVREPMPDLRATAQMEPVKAAPVAAAPKVAATVSGPAIGEPVAQRPAPAKRASVQTEQRASKSTPIKGKPFQPHPIFMARPPK